MSVLPRRRGTILIVALLCLLVVMSLLGTMLLAAMQSTRQLHAERDLRQCELLLQAGIERALTRLAEQPDYQGETHELTAAEIIDQGTGRLTIAVTPATSDGPSQLLVSAEYPAGSEFAVRRSRTISIPSNAN
jgi:type II secretory pathway component PulK